LKHLLIIYPHWHPVNLAGVHRPRLVGNYLKDFNWKPVVVTVLPKYFEENPDPDFIKTFSSDFEVHRVKAFKITRPRIIGDIGLRAFFHLYRKAKKITQEQKIDFIWIPIPSFYTSLLGRILYSKTKIPYGIDYIDPWVRDISTRNDWRHRLSNALARFLEPIAVKKASLITGVSEGYYLPVLERNFLREVNSEGVKREEVNSETEGEVKSEGVNSETEGEVKSGEVKSEGVNSETGREVKSEGVKSGEVKSEGVNSEKNNKIENTFSPLTSHASHFTSHDSQPFTIHHTAFPYGFDPKDHEIQLSDIQYPWSEGKEVIPWIYAGAFLPNSRIFVEVLFRAIRELKTKNEWNESIKLYFIGTGSYPGKRITEFAEQAGISEIVVEDRSRYPFLHILNFLSASDTVMVIGSTEKHYTASKVYQALLSKRPVWAVFHEGSSAVRVLQECKADDYLVRYSDSMLKEQLLAEIKKAIQSRLQSTKWHPDLKALNKYSAKASARKLVEVMEFVLSEK
jgi:Tfp pilus assembly major pilin PilA